MHEDIKLFLFDVDGVLTDGRIILDANGIETKAFDVRDGSGITWLTRAGIASGFLSGRTSAVVDNRARELGVTIVRQGAEQKRVVYAEILSTLGLESAQVAYMGDDLIDLPVMREVALSFAPADAHPEVRELATFVTRARGGRGAAREAIEILLKASNRWEAVVARYHA